MAGTAILERETELVAMPPEEMPLPEEPEDSEHPMSETEAEAIDIVRESLRNLTEGRGITVLMARYTRLEYVLEGRRRHYVPDLLAAFELRTLGEDVYAVPAVGKAPELILEIASPTTVARDLSVKAGRYEALGVKEYFVFDPRHDSEDLERRSLPHRVPLVGYYRNERGEFELELARAGRLESRLLGVTLEVHGPLLRLRAPDGQLVPTDRELAERRLHDREQAEQERRQAVQEREAAAREKQQAEDRVRQLEAELARLRGSTGP